MDMNLSSPEMADFSFHGFSLTDIFGDSVFIIQPQSMSKTVSVNPKLYDSVTEELEKRYVWAAKGAKRVYKTQKGI